MNEVGGEVVGGANIRLLCGLLNIRCHFYKKTERAVKFCLKYFG